MKLEDSNYVLFSIQPKWVYKILIGTKLIEIRKRVPKLKPPFTCYIYCTMDNKFPLSLGPFGPGMLKDDDPDYNMQGKIVGQFTCSEIREYTYDENNPYYDISDDDLELSKLTQKQLYEYGKGKTLYGIVISDVITYEKPFELGMMTAACPYFMTSCNCTKDEGCEYLYYYECYDYCDEYCMCDGFPSLKRPPQSWQYVEKFDYESFYNYQKSDPELDSIIRELFGSS
jgi:predicted transcriptional regulator